MKEIDAELSKRMVAEITAQWRKVNYIEGDAEWNADKPPKTAIDAAKGFERDVEELTAVFRNALVECDNDLFSNKPEVVGVMVRVAGFEIPQYPCLGFHVEERLGQEIDGSWANATAELQRAIYEWLEVLDFSNKQLRKFKDDTLGRAGVRLRGKDDGYTWGLSERMFCDDVSEHDERKRYGLECIYHTRDYFRRLVSIARGCAAHAGKIGTAANVTHTQQGGERDAGTAGHDTGTDDSLLNDNAARFVSEYKSGVSFRCVFDDCPDGVTVNIHHDLSNANIGRVEKLLLEGCYTCGWCRMPDDWKRPSAYKTDAERIFFTHIESKRDIETEGYVEGNAHLFRLSPVEVKRRRGGSNKGARGVGAGRGNKKQ